MLWVTAKATFFPAFNPVLISHLKAKADENHSILELCASHLAPNAVIFSL